MAAPVLLRVSVPRWERVARYAVCAAGILLSIYAYHVEREKERDPEHRALCDLGPWVKCSAALASRHDSKRCGGFDPHDVLHHVGRGVPVPGLHSVLCAEGVLHHLHRHVRAELPSSHYQLQTTSLLERGLEAAAATQAGLTPDRLHPNSLKPLSIQFILQQVFIIIIIIIIHNRHFP
ncbi:VKORC1L1 isoform 2 [Pan troglodytes]|uniref:VKORC1L1 isoform 2 n=3 Tax=Homininae TaxID=207598 RepID=A0A6D2XXC1_PANTR|nr:vitamin K epoxide reductase complex subunit 1-like protein 1 isoform 2 [Homo sapiens]KAI2546048.1 vitamin K epoxide reductase complex subunit 1 like 1 [Homo sapiens]KAI4013977.1 vitamin K epoxide reductase complex subunit 1 like 1 [Homo sapiens]PNI18801.1 VKORC1L1 isoform 2 [Pan troglodytes]|eukprot:NP_001271271.1 vitamin K epoxide reductase complex subunit 1-like protein 1 isoform 2 [Homo sapiens]